jgi:hypothetical protein
MKEEQLNKRLLGIENAIIYLSECIQDGQYQDVRNTTINILAEYTLPLAQSPRDN